MLYSYCCRRLTGQTPPEIPEPIWRQMSFMQRCWQLSSIRPSLWTRGTATKPKLVRPADLPLSAPSQFTKMLCRERNAWLYDAVALFYFNKIGSGGCVSGDRSGCYYLHPPLSLFSLAADLLFIAYHMSNRTPLIKYSALCGFKSRMCLLLLTLTLTLKRRPLCCSLRPGT